MGFVFGLFVMRLRSEMKKLSMLSSEEETAVVAGGRLVVVAVTIGGRVKRGGFRVGLEVGGRGRESGLSTEGGGRGRRSSAGCFSGIAVLRVEVTVIVLVVEVVVFRAGEAVLFLLDVDVVALRPLLEGLTAGGGLG